MNKIIKVLIVDDHHLVRQGLSLILNSQEHITFEITELDSGEKAVKEHLKVNFDITLMDITMGGISGIEATKLIIEHNKSAKIIALSMHNETFMIKKMVDAGVVGYILKNTEANELIKAIETVLSNQKYYSNEVALKLMGECKEKKRQEFNKSTPQSLKLSNREMEIINLISQQLTNEEIADVLGIGKRTVDSHRQKILEKLGVKNTAGLIMFATKNDLLQE